MTTGLPFLTGLLSVVLFASLRWAHRSWVKVFLATLFTPLVAVPLGAVAYLALTALFHILNPAIVMLGFELTNATVHHSALAITSIGMIGLLIHYCREQRAIAHIQTGPRLGVRYQVADAKLNRRGPLK